MAGVVVHQSLIHDPAIHQSFRSKITTREKTAMKNECVVSSGSVHSKW